MIIPLNSGIKLFGWCTCFNHNPSFLICFSGGRCSREDNRLKCFCSVCSVLWHPFKYFSTVVISELPACGIQCLGTFLFFSCVFWHYSIIFITNSVFKHALLYRPFFLSLSFSFNLRFFVPVNCFLLHCISFSYSLLSAGVTSFTCFFTPLDLTVLSTHSVLIFLCFCCLSLSTPWCFLFSLCRS